MTKPASEVRAYPVEFRRQSNRQMTGLVATYGRVYDVGVFTETLHPGVFKKSIAESARALPLLTMHDHESIPVGRAVKWDDDEERLLGTWEFDTRAEAVEAARLAEEGYLTGLSVGFLPILSRWDETGEKPHTDRHEARLLETSLVPVQAYSDAGVLAIRSAGHPERAGLAVVPTPRLLEARALLDSLRRP
jgi:HK97 family phage prohead protease